ncbi:MAG: RNA polymerase sigma-70 factor [Tannerella sp.]|nr:RNA polymerase sigma-70 factor [Tannerella sp.]
MTDNSIKRDFEQMYKNLHPRIYAYCRKYIADRETARDIVQDSFIKLWENFDIITTSHSAYLFQIVTNACLTHFREMKLKAEHEEYVGWQLREYEIHPCGAPEALQQLYLKDLEDRLHQSLEQMPDACRKIFMMSRFENMSNRDIADKLGISIRTVENQIYSALKMLKKDLKDFYPVILCFFSIISRFPL